MRFLLCKHSDLFLPFSNALVLLGRGAPAIQHEGNVRFRALVQARKQEYARTECHSAKEEIATQIVHEVANRQGKFVRRVATIDERRYLGAPEDSPVWVVTDFSIALEKTKQTLRERQYVRPHRHQEGGETSPTETVASITLHYNPVIAALGENEGQGTSVHSSSQSASLSDPTPPPTPST